MYQIVIFILTVVIE